MKGIITSVTSSRTDTKSYVTMFIRMDDGTRKRVNVPFRPYFYLDKRDIRHMHRFTNIPWRFVDTTAKGYFGQELDRIEVEFPEQLHDIRKRLTASGVYTFEADVPYENRFLIDYKLKLAVDITDDGKVLPDDTYYKEPRYWVIDIESYVINDEKIDVRGPEPMINIGIYDSYDLKYYILYVGEGFTRKIKNADYIPCRDEAEMCKMFISLIKEKDPDILTGFNLQGYDIPKFVYRCRHLGLNPSQISPVRKIRQGSNDTYTVGGLEIVDLYEIARFLSGKELRAYNLDYVNKTLGSGKGKVELDGSINENWEKNKWEVLIYNKRDLDCVLEVILEQDLISYLDEIRRLAGITYNDILYKTNLFDVYILRYLDGKKILWSKMYNKRKTFEGGYVREPVPGLYKNVVVCDFESLYPSCMITFNIGRFTLKGVETRDPVDYVWTNCVISKKIEIADTDIIVDDQHIFNGEEPSLISLILKELLAMRKETKRRIANAKNMSERDLYSKQDAAFKTVVNSAFGVLGKETFRLYHPSLGEAICSAGRSCTRYAIQVAEDLGYPVIYGDTDSIFVHLGNDFNGDAVAEGQKIAKKITTRFAREAPLIFGNISENRIVMNMETVFESLAIWAKKNYLGKISWKKGREMTKYDWKGMAAIRSDTMPLLRDLQNKIGKSLVDGESAEYRKEYLDELNEKFLSKLFTVQDLASPRQIKKPLEEYEVQQPHVRGGLYSNQYLGTKFGKGDKPAWVYIVPPSNYPPTDVISFTRNTDIPNGFKPDYTNIVDRLIQPVIDSFLSLVGEEYKLPSNKYNWGLRGTLDYYFGG